MSTARVYKEYSQPNHVKQNNSVSFKFLEKRQALPEQKKLAEKIVKSLIVISFAFVSIQLVRGTVINIDRFATLSSKLTGLQTLNDKASYQNAVLKKNYNTYTSSAGVESLARDYLNLVGDNEIAIVLKKG